MTTSLSRLRRREVELMQVHNLVDVRTHLRTLRRWSEEGRCRYLGVTHHLPSSFPAIEALVRTERLDFIQIPYSMALRQAEATLLPLAHDRGVAVVVNRPFEGGDLFGRTRGREVPPAARELGCLTWAQVFLKFLLGHPAVTCVIPGTGDPHHLDDNMAAGRGPVPDARGRQVLLQSLN